MINRAVLSTDWLDECRSYCKRIKYLGQPLVWEERPNRSDTLVVRSPLLDEDRIAVQGLSFEGEYKVATFGDVFRCKVIQREFGPGLRVFMLEVYPAHKMSHRGADGDIYGTHIHLGDERAGTCIVKPVRGGPPVGSLQRWMERFRRHARTIDDGEATLIPPFLDSLFGVST